MFGLMCCAAQDALDQAGEVITSKAAEAHGHVKAAVNSHTLGNLKEALEGSRVQEWNEPDVFVEITQVDLEEGVEIASLLNFNLKGLKVDTKVEIVGTAAQLAGMVAAGGAKKAADAVSGAEAALQAKLGLPALGIGRYVADAASGAKSKLASSASSGTETKSANFNLSVDLDKVLGVEEVKATAKIVGTSSDVLAKYIAQTSIQAYVEDAISRRVTAIVTEWQNSTITADKARQKLGEAAAGIQAGAASAASAAATAADDLARVKGLKK